MADGQVQRTGPPRILIVEDNPVIRKALEFQLGVTGYDVVSATSGSTAVQAVAEQKPDLMILDLSLMEGTSDALQDGFAMLNWLRRVVPDSNFPVIIHTMDDSRRVDERARSEGVCAVFRKGDGVPKLLAAVERALQESRAETLDSK